MSNFAHVSFSFNVSKQHVVMLAPTNLTYAILDQNLKHCKTVRLTPVHSFLLSPPPLISILNIHHLYEQTVLTVPRVQ